MNARVIGLLTGLLAALLAGCQAAAPSTHAGPTTAAPINDSLFLRRLESNATELCDAGKARTLIDLGRDLDRDNQRISAKLPEPEDKPIALPALYDRRIHGVLVVARVYKCERCSNWHHAREASAFVLSADGLCATCRHVFKGDESGCMIAADVDGNVYPISEIVASSVADDIAIFRVGARGLDPLPLRVGAPVGTPICLISHPRHQHYLLTTGIIARRGEKFSGVIGDQEQLRDTPTPIINITADYGSGSSGAPVLDLSGNAVGMVALTTTVHAEASKESEPQMVIKTCIPAERIMGLVRP